MLTYMWSCEKKCWQMCRHTQMQTYMSIYQDVVIYADILGFRHMSAFLCRHADCSISSTNLPHLHDGIAPCIWYLKLYLFPGEWCATLKKDPIWDASQWMSFTEQLAMWMKTHLAFQSVAVWASCQIRKILGCACAGNAGNVFPAAAV